MQILNLEPENYSFKASAILKGLGSVVNGPMTRDQMLADIGRYDGIIVRLGHQIDREILSCAERLKVIVTATTGLNHIDLDYAVAKNITVLSLRGERAFLDSIHATAEHTFALLLSLVRSVPAAHVDVLAGRWSRDSFKGGELFGKTIGIVGLGRLGSKVAQYAKAFGMRVIAHDTDAAVFMPDVEMVDLMTLAEEANIVSLHIPSNIENYHFIDTKFYGALKPGAIVINTARGDVHDQSALLAGLESGRIAGAAIDVLEEENNGTVAESPLIAYAKNHRNLIITPHVGGATFESMEKTEIFMAEKLAAWCVRV